MLIQFINKRYLSNNVDMSIGTSVIVTTVSCDIGLVKVLAPVSRRNELTEIERLHNLHKFVEGYRLVECSSLYALVQSIPFLSQELVRLEDV